MSSETTTIQLMSPKPACAIAPAMSIGTAWVRSVPTRIEGRRSGYSRSSVVTISEPEPTLVMPTRMPTNRPSSSVGTGLIGISVP